MYDNKDILYLESIDTILDLIVNEIIKTVSAFTVSGSQTMREIHEEGGMVKLKAAVADTFGISRTSMRSPKAIMEQAAANGIEFEGLE